MRHNIRSTPKTLVLTVLIFGGRRFSFYPREQFHHTWDQKKDEKEFFRKCSPTTTVDGRNPAPVDR